MAKKVIMRQSSPYAKMIDSRTGYVFYKDRATLVDDDYDLMSELKLEGEKEEEPKKKKVKKKPQRKTGRQEEEKDLSNLSKIKGIGEETVKDIERVYGSIAELRSALKENKVPLRNDVVIKLKEELL